MKRRSRTAASGESIMTDKIGNPSTFYLVYRSTKMIIRKSTPPTIAKA
jgi:hypothetical protein